MNENVCISIKISLKFVPNVPINNISALVQITAWCVHVTSDSGAQIRYTLRSRALLGFATSRDVSADKQAHQYQQMKRQQPIKHIRKQKWTYTA